MSIQGKEAVLKSSLIAEIQAAILAQTGNAPVEPNAIEGLCEGIPNALIPFIVSNLEVVAGQSVTVSTPAGPGSGQTTSNGSVT